MNRVCSSSYYHYTDISNRLLSAYLQIWSDLDSFLLLPRSANTKPTHSGTTIVPNCASGSPKPDSITFVSIFLAPVLVLSIHHAFFRHIVQARSNNDAHSE